MNIQYYGHSCFKITTKPAGRGQEDVNVFIDPFDKKIGLRPPQGQADLVLVTHDHYDHNNVSALKGVPTIIDTPGEYSVRGINIIGLQSEHFPLEAKKESVLNTIFILESEDLKICHLGDLGTELTEKQLEEIDGVDILMIPVGGHGYTIDAKIATDLVKKIEPHIIIPIHYRLSGTTVDIEDEKKFCGMIGNCSREKISRLSIKKKDLENKVMETVVMTIE